MFCLFFMMTMMADGPVFHIRDTGIFQPPEPGLVVLSKERIYLLNREENEVRIYDRQGRFLKKFGKRGQGPDEFIMVSYLAADNDRCFVYDGPPGIMKIFDKDGRFLKDYRPPGPDWHYYRVADGWVFGAWSFFTPNEANVPVLWMDDAFSRKKTLIEMNPGQPSGNVSRGGTRFNLSKGLSVNPAREQRLIAVSPDLQHVFVRHIRDDVLITILEVRQKKPIAMIRENRARIPFNVSWGERIIEGMNQSKSGSGFKIKALPDFPDFFPSVRGMRALSDGLLYVQYWSKQPESEPEVAVYNTAGSQARSSFPVQYLDRILDVDGDNVFILCFEPATEEAGLALCPIETLPDFIKANPFGKTKAGGPVFHVSQ